MYHVLHVHYTTYNTTKNVLSVRIRIYFVSSRVSTCVHLIGAVFCQLLVVVATVLRKWLYCACAMLQRWAYETSCNDRLSVAVMSACRDHQTVKFCSSSFFKETKTSRFTVFAFSTFCTRTVRKH